MLRAVVFGAGVAARKRLQASASATSKFGAVPNEGRKKAGAKLNATEGHDD